eukprot:7829013-Lingulodinium_polyedra.AAC.1
MPCVAMNHAPPMAMVLKQSCTSVASDARATRAPSSTVTASIPTSSRGPPTSPACKAETEDADV